MSNREVEIVLRCNNTDAAVLCAVCGRRYVPPVGPVACLDYWPERFAIICDACVATHNPVMGRALARVIGQCV
ncbi:MAG: hypothetical protein K8S99_03525 [Planctomycetes bacterium]|nr:hypothetical protein [Planctomycetota bacterium]